MGAEINNFIFFSCLSFYVLWLSLAMILRLAFLTSQYVEQSQWTNVFSGIVSRAVTLEVLSTGVAGNYNGALQVVCIFRTNP